MLTRAPDPVCDDVIVSTGQPANQAKKFERVSVFRPVMTGLLCTPFLSVFLSRDGSQTGAIIIADDDDVRTNLMII